MVHVAEGIEDGLTIAMVKPAERVVAAGTLGNIGAMQLPDAVAGLVIIGQHDRPGSPADQSLEKQIAAQQKLGRRVACLWPEPGFKDFNDQLRGVRKEGV
nr:toprim domain-containing protein [Sphingomonas sp. S2M10]